MLVLGLFGFELGFVCVVVWVCLVVGGVLFGVVAFYFIFVSFVWGFFISFFLSSNHVKFIEQMTCEIQK